MNFLDLKNISERELELINPTSPEKVLTVGRVLGLQAGQRVIDFGCGFGEVLALWAQHVGIVGVGIDIRPYACERAQRKMREHGFAQQIEIVCMNGAEYAFEPHTFAVAACLGATFIFEGFRPTLRRLKEAIHPDGQLVVGEAHWLTTRAPPEFAKTQSEFYQEHELLEIAHEERLELKFVVRASHDDWDHYEASSWRGLLRWLKENPQRPERAEVLEHLHSSQDEYLRYGRAHLGWAMYVLQAIRA